jgi:hypothetical protein
MRSISAAEIAPPLAADACVWARITGADSEKRARIAAKNTLSFNNRFVLIFQILRTELLNLRRIFVLLTGRQMPEKNLMLPSQNRARKTESQNRHEQAILVLQNSMHLM